jgi:hypothetical protein
MSCERVYLVYLIFAQACGHDLLTLMEAAAAMTQRERWLKGGVGGGKDADLPGHAKVPRAAKLRGHRVARDSKLTYGLVERHPQAGRKSFAGGTGKREMAALIARRGYSCL